jgi:phage portal protein BeeE
VAGSGLQYQPMVIPAVDAQLIEQLKWTVEDVARCFHIPLYKLGGSVPPNTTIEALNQGYYSECLQILIEALEDSLGSGLELKDGYEIECDLEGLLRMDTAARFKAWSEGIKGGWLKPDEGRAKEGLPPVDGGNACYLQQQNFSLAALAKRDALPNPFVIDRPTTNPTPSADGPPAAADPSAKHLDSADDLEMVPAFGILAQRKLAPLLTHT